MLEPQVCLCPTHTDIQPHHKLTHTHFLASLIGPIIPEKCWPSAFYKDLLFPIVPIRVHVSRDAEGGEVRHLRGLLYPRRDTV